MHWEWLVPVIFLIVWIVSSLIQGAEKERSRMNRSRSLPGGNRPSGDTGSRRPTTDIDRFLEEVNRRRRQAAERRPVAGDRDTPPATKVIPVASAARPRVSPRPATGRSAGSAQPIRSRSGKIPEAIPVTETTAAAEVLAVASVLRATPTSGSLAAPPPRDPGAAAKPEASVLPPLVELLSAPDNLRTAVILHEIFGPPRSRHSAIR